MSSETHRQASDQWNDEIKQNYSLKKIYRYERIFGPTWISIGSEAIAKEFCLSMKLKRGDKVLDIGCGTGGCVYHMARKFGCFVHGIDLCSEMISLCHDRLNWEEEIVKNRITFETGDVCRMNFPDNEFDVIHSKNVLLYVKDKQMLFSRIQPWLKSGGKVLISDYVHGQRENSPDFSGYLQDRGFHVPTLPEYENALRNAGFRIIDIQDWTNKFLKISEEELRYFKTSKEAFIADFCVEDYEWILDDWETKMRLARVDELRWCLFICTK